MGEATIRDLRNHGGEVIDRVSAGERITITRDGKPVAELRPLPRRRLTAVALIEQFRGLPASGCRPVPDRDRRCDRPVTMSGDLVGVLDTNTLLLLDRLNPDGLPAEPVITAVTLAR